MERKKYIALVKIRDAQVLNPDEGIPDYKEDETAYLDVAGNDNNWKDIEVDGFLGVYDWDNDAESLRLHVAKQHRLHPEGITVKEV